jgi:hypothetical protein
VKVPAKARAFAKLPNQAHTDQVGLTDGVTGISGVLIAAGFLRAIAAVAYALCLSYTVIAALGSQHGGRAFNESAAAALAGERVRLEATYKRAEVALAKLPQTRPAAVVQAEVDAKLKNPRLNGCEGWLENSRLRAICIDEVQPLQRELANPTERQRLSRELDATSDALKSLSVGKPANSDAISLGRYLSALGVTVDSERLADLINLLTVAGVELVGGICFAVGSARPAESHGRKTVPTASVSSAAHAVPAGTVPATVPAATPEVVPAVPAATVPGVSADVPAAVPPSVLSSVPERVPAAVPGVSLGQRNTLNVVPFLVSQPASIRLSQELSPPVSQELSQLARKRPSQPSQAGGVPRAEELLLGHLLQHGSTDALGGSIRTIADALGLQKTTLTRAADALAQRGVIEVETTKKGTRLTLKLGAA